MLVFGLHPTTEVSVQDYAMLRELWKSYKDSLAWEFIGSVAVEEPLTDAQLRRLHRDLRAKVRCADDSVPFLEALWSLDDPRG
jgi:hypothetical protein